MPVVPFLTSYDPSDPPGGSIDPLGFERGYLFLADKILPGLTNVANRPRYFSVLCAGVSLADAGVEGTPREKLRRRLEHVLRLERFWALGNVLAAGLDGEEDLATQGLRGVRRASTVVEELSAKGVRKTKGDFSLLSNQSRYGVVGIYGAVADGLRFWDRRPMQLTPDLGDRLGSGFIQETAMPPELQRAVRDGGEVQLRTLREWGERAHLSARVTEAEASCFADAAYREPLRARMLDLLEEFPWNEEESEVERLMRIAEGIEELSGDADIREAALAIVAYEECYALALLAFERLLYLCASSAAGTVALGEVDRDEVLQAVCDRLPSAVGRLDAALDEATTSGFRDGIDRLLDVRGLLMIAAASEAPSMLARTLLKRHQDVQHGKLDRGRRKTPWIENNDDRMALAMTRVGGLSVEPTSVDQIAAHPYRLGAADALIAAARAR
jgi:hypothetical protein